MVPAKFRSYITHISIDKDVPLMKILLTDGTLDEFNMVGARFLMSDTVDIIYQYMLSNANNSMKLYLEDMDIPIDNNNQRDRNNWAQMLSIFFMNFRTDIDPEQLLLNPEVLYTILKVNTYYTVGDSPSATN